jgi:hypothetical protein
MRIGALLSLPAYVALTVASTIACGGGLFRQYEYEEEMYLSLDGSATVYVNSSIPALNALRGSTFDLSPAARIDRAAIRRFFTTPVTRVTRLSTSRRSNRRFVHVRLDVDDVKRLGAAAPFAWSSYQFGKDGGIYVYRQAIDASAGKDVGNVGWTEQELVAFRMHLPSKIVYHNTLSNVGRGNILAWEQLLVDRLRGTPLTLDARMEAQSILYRTLWLFGATLVAVAISFGLVIWWLVRRGARTPAGAEPRVRPGVGA